MTMIFVLIMFPATTDVYKRQPSYSLTVLFSPDLRSQSPGPEKNRGSQPVSYTHLDVYKRQP